MVVRPFTDLLRQPNDVTNDVEKGDVILRRRGAPDLRLTRADREAERAAAVAGLARALRSFASNRTRMFHRAIEDAFPWSGALPATDRKLFAEELSRLLAAGADLDAYGAVAETVADWRSKAEAHGGPRRPREPAAVKRSRSEPHEAGSAAGRPPTAHGRRRSARPARPPNLVATPTDSSKGSKNGLG